MKSSCLWRHESVVQYQTFNDFTESFHQYKQCMSKLQKVKTQKLFWLIGVIGKLVQTNHSRAGLCKEC